jgi:hypothetical protein
MQLPGFLCGGTRRGFVCCAPSREATRESAPAGRSMQDAENGLLRIYLPRTPVNKEKKGAAALSRPGPFQLLLVYESRSLRSPFFCLALPFL